MKQLALVHEVNSCFFLPVLQTCWKSAEAHGRENANKIKQKAIEHKEQAKLLFCFCGCQNADAQDDTQEKSVLVFDDVWSFLSSDLASAS